MRYKALKEGRKNLYDGSWRNRPPSDAPSGISPVVRLKTELTGKTSINDLVQGLVTVDNEIIDDFILLRADGSPTYMHSVVVDDHDMQVSHVIRGDDHLNNAFRQIQLYKAMGWEIPVFAHMPLIHGQDGTKLSKRHGALGVESYRDLGYLPDALCNYLLRLGWSHGDDEIISRKDALKWFDFDKVGQSASRFDITKLDNINSVYIKNLDDDYLIKLLIKELEKRPNLIINSTTMQRIKAGIKGLKTRVKTIKELAEISTFYMAKTPLQLDQKARNILNEDAIKIINGLREPLKDIENWSESAVETAIKRYAEKYNLKLANVALPLRVALTGTTTSPSIFEVAGVLGWDEVDLRIESVCRK
jgi:glutamyl-tRNA synthetase